MSKNTNRVIDSTRWSVLEDNIIAILDASVNSTCNQYTNDDWLEFLEAVKTAFLHADQMIPPSQKIVKEVFHILRDGESLELITESFCLLCDLLKLGSPVQVSSSDSREVKDAWSPFDVTEGSRQCMKINDAKVDLIDPTGFHMIIQFLFEVNNNNNETDGKKLMRNMFLFQYLVDVLEIDFTLRKAKFKESMNWCILRESLLSTLLSSKRINFKNLVTDSIHLLCSMFKASSESYNASETCKSMRKFFICILELDELQNKAEELSATTRVDFARRPILEVIIDELSYEKDMIFPFLHVFDEPKWKLQVVLQYLTKYTPMASIRTRRSNNLKEINFQWMMECFSTSAKSKTLAKKIGINVIQVLLSQGFQAQISLEEERPFVVDVCKALVSAFRSIQNSNENFKILDIGKEALFVASTIISSE